MSTTERGAEPESDVNAGSARQRTEMLEDLDWILETDSSLVATLGMAKRWPGHLPWWGVVAILGAGLLWAGKLHEGRAGGSCCGGSSKGVRAWLKSGGPFSTRHTAVHEAGHAGVAVAQGKGFNAEVYGPSEGGWCGIGQWWRDPIDSIAFLLGGQVAAGRSLGDRGDNDKIKAFLRGFPEDARAGALAEAYRRCARGLAATSGLRERVAERLRTTGKASG